MARRCRVCLGVYEPVLPDGQAYYHVCSNVPNPAYQPDSSKPAYDPRETLGRVNYRDENVDPTIGANLGRPKRPGTGAVDI